MQTIWRHSKGAVSREFCHFFISWIEAFWAPDIQAKMVLLKNLFSRRYLQNQWLCAMLACAESDSVQVNTARSQKFKCPQIQNWLIRLRVLPKRKRNFVFAGLSLSSIKNLKISKLYVYFCLHSPTFLTSFLKG